MSRTIFVAGGSGFIGVEFCQVCVAAGDTVLALCRSQESACRMEELGAIPVKGDLLQPGNWQEQARAAEYVVQLAQPKLDFGRVTVKRAEAYARECAVMDTNLMDALDSRKVKRMVYVSGALYYGDLGRKPCDETATPRPCGMGRFIVESVERVGDYAKKGLPVVTVFPGEVYGPGSWFTEYIFGPLVRGKRLLAVGNQNPYISPIHVGDCARAIFHLLAHGGVGERYFLVDDKPVQWSDLQTGAAEALGVRLRVLRIPSWLAALFMGRIVVESLGVNFVLSNAKLKALGFSFAHPTIDTGVPAVVGELRKPAMRT